MFVSLVIVFDIRDCVTGYGVFASLVIVCLICKTVSLVMECLSH